MHLYDIVQKIISVAGYPAIFLIEMCEGIGIPLPAETALVGASVYAAITGQLSIGLIILISTFGAFSGDVIGYMIGRKKGSTVISFIGTPLHISKEKFDHLEGFYKKYGSITVFIGRFTTLLRIASPILAGTNKMPITKFIIFNFLGCFLWSLLYGLISYNLGLHFNLLMLVLKRISILTFIIIFAILALIIFIYIKKSRQSKDEIGK